jgi:hypothetical protein
MIDLGGLEKGSVEKPIPQLLYAIGFKVKIEIL